tara:strand:+ start:3442 stop:4476 length:1035 start_codon:yes stop_codon:yes gene_type:complete
MTRFPPRRYEGTIQAQRKKLPWPEGKPFRILSIDGGGICGILPAAILSELEQRYLGGQSVNRHFDLIAGTSTGGIIALGLGRGLRSRDALDLYMEEGARIFPSGNAADRFFRRVRHTFRYIHDEKILNEKLRNAFGDHLFGDSVARLVIPSFEGCHGEPWIYKTPHHPDYRKDRHEQMVNVARATSAAPSYYPSFEHNAYSYVDGGIWANNPVMNAIVDVLACFELDRRQIRVLSLGCGESIVRVTPHMRRAGLIGWRQAIKAAISAQSKNALGQAYLLLGKDNITRLDAPESSREIALDDYARASTELPPMARSLVEAAGHHIRGVFLSDEVVQYRPVVEAAA